MNYYRNQKRALREIEREAEEAALADKQSKCFHWDCECVRMDIKGRVREVRCKDCGYQTHIEHPE